MNKKAFTLIELLVVVLIIGILAAVALPQYEKAVEKSRAAEAFVMLKHLKDAQEVYYMANGVYATSFEELGEANPSGKYFSYTMGSLSIRAESYTQPYIIAFRYEHRNKASYPADVVCGFSISVEGAEEKAKPWCKMLGADVSVKESANTWTMHL